MDNDCVPVTLFEMPDLIALATNQMQWTDLVGMAPDDPKHNEKVGLLLVTEAHLEYNAGLVISIGSQGRPSPIRPQSPQLVQLCVTAVLSGRLVPSQKIAERSQQQKLSIRKWLKCLQPNLTIHGACRIIQSQHPP